MAGALDRFCQAVLRNTGAILPANIVDQRDPQPAPVIRGLARRGRLVAGPRQIFGSHGRQLDLECRLVCRLLPVMQPEPCEGPPEHMEPSALLGETQPQLVIHAEIQALRDPGAGLQP